MTTLIILSALACMSLMAAAPGGDPDPNADPSPGTGGANADPGAVDNRLSLDPSDDRWKGYVDEWEDGKDYSVTLTVRQISPGEFEVTEIEDAKPAEAAEEAKPGDDAGDGGAAPEINTTSDNPAIKNLMKE